MSKNIESSLRFINYIVNKIEFYTNKDFKEEPIEVEFKIRKQIEYLEDENNTMNVTIEAKIFENPTENNYPFSMNIILTGIFELENCDLYKRESFAEVNSIAILFPYLRAIVSTFTANANIQPLILPPINIVKLVSKSA